jgi:hypothetical protein
VTIEQMIARCIGLLPRLSPEQVAVILAEMEQLATSLGEPRGQEHPADATLITSDPIRGVGHSNDDVGRPKAILAALRGLQNIEADAVDELERVIAAGQLPVQDDGFFDKESPP